MRTNRSRRTRKLWRNGAIGIVLLGTGLMTAMAVAEIGGGRSTPTPERALQSAIARQRVATAQPAATPAAPTPAAPSTTPGAPTTSPGGPPTGGDMDPKAKILAEVARLEAEMNNTIDHTEASKKAAYEAHDIIRMNYVTGKLSEMKNLKSTIQPVIDSIRDPSLSLFDMQAKLTIIREGVQQIRDASAAAEAAEGDTAAMAAGIDSINESPGGTNTANDPSEPPPAPTLDNTTGVDRPGEASPYQ
ncbi:MAG TPA: hypothetical protein VHJ20_15825 [Polyangia bacterium]|nr:hypothetical protein [Polyangia bacterium]